MPSTSLKTAKAPGQITVGVDNTGKHYMYVAGQGRGRKPLHLSSRQAAVLNQRGLKPGAPVALSGTEAQQLGIGGSTAAAKRQAPMADKRLAREIIASHAKWVAETQVKGKSASAARLQLMLGRGRREWLEKGGGGEAKKAFAGAVLGAILGRGLKLGAKGGKFKVHFAPGGENGDGHITVTGEDGSKVGSVKFQSLKDFDAKGIEAARQHFAKAKAQYGKQEEPAKQSPMKPLAPQQERIRKQAHDIATRAFPKFDGAQRSDFINQYTSASPKDRRRVLQHAKSLYKETKVKKTAASHKRIFEDMVKKAHESIDTSKPLSAEHEAEVQKAAKPKAAKPKTVKPKAAKPLGANHLKAYRENAKSAVKLGKFSTFVDAEGKWDTEKLRHYKQIFKDLGHTLGEPTVDKKSGTVEWGLTKTAKRKPKGK